jgi:hypothetical protein
MQRHRFISLIVLVAAVASWGMVLTVSGQDKPAAIEITRAVIGTGVENLEPKGVAETFPASTEKVFCYLEAKNIPKDTEVAFIWSMGDKEMLKYSTTLQAGARWRTYASKNLYGKKGDWKVEIKDAGGKVLKEVKFKVE